MFGSVGCTYLYENIRVSQVFRTDRQPENEKRCQSVYKINIRMAPNHAPMNHDEKAMTLDTHPLNLTQPTPELHLLNPHSTISETHIQTLNRAYLRTRHRMMVRVKREMTRLIQPNPKAKQRPLLSLMGSSFLPCLREDNRQWFSNVL